MSKYIKGRPHAYDPRSGFKVPLDEMVEDGEKPGLFVHQREADELNMQRYPATMFPEGMLDRAFPPNESELDVVMIGEIYDPATFAPLVYAAGSAASGTFTVT